MGAASEMLPLENIAARLLEMARQPVARAARAVT
jgi:hypothetical protein